jgi:hypothetical protein
MSADYLTNLAARTLGIGPTIRPRLPSLFEPVHPPSPPNSHEGFEPEQSAGDVVGRSATRLTRSPHVAVPPTAATVAMHRDALPEAVVPGGNTRTENRTVAPIAHPLEREPTEQAPGPVSRSASIRLRAPVTATVAFESESPSATTASERPGLTATGPPSPEPSTGRVNGCVGRSTIRNFHEHSNQTESTAAIPRGEANRVTPRDRSVDFVDLNSDRAEVARGAPEGRQDKTVVGTASVPIRVEPGVAHIADETSSIDQLGLRAVQTVRPPTVGTITPAPGVKRRRDSMPASEPSISKQEPTIQVTIGRVEVRAVPPASTPRAQRTAPAVMGLADYLRRRTQGERS